MLTSILIIAASTALFLYWFRYTCLLLLARADNADYALKVASTVRLNFPEVQQALQALPQTPALDRLHQRLEYDYEVLNDLLRHSSDSDTVERFILMIDYKVMRLRYRASRNSMQARTALAEMSSILGFFAAEIGENAAA